MSLIVHTLTLLFLVMPLSVSAASVTLQVGFVYTRMQTEDSLNEFVQPFLATHPDIQVEFVPRYSNLDTFQVHMAGGAAPDILESYGTIPLIGMESGFFLNLMPFLERDGLVDLLEDFVPAAIEVMSMDGGVYGLPQSSAVGATYYNAEHFEQAGIAPPPDDWTLDDFKLTAKKLTKFDGTKVTNYGYNQFAPWIWVFPWFVRGGVRFDDRYELPLDTPEAIEMAHFLHEMIVDEESTFWGWAAFPEGRASMAMSGSWELELWSQSGLSTGIAATPAGPGGKSTLTNNNTVSVNVNTKHPNEAWTFLKWFYSEDVQREYFRRYGSQPARLSLGLDWARSYQDSLAARGAANKIVGDLSAFLDESVYARPEPIFANAAVTTPMIDEAMNKIMTGEAPVETTLQSLVEQAEAAMREAREAN